jgi:hypothetical protein
MNLSITRSVGSAQGAVRGRIGQAEWTVLRQIVERERHDGCDGQYFGDVGTMCHRYNPIFMIHFPARQLGAARESAPTVKFASQGLLPALFLNGPLNR